MRKRRILITGGAGFIGCNAAARFMREGWETTVLDNLSRPGSPMNKDWLASLGDLRFVKADIRDARATAEAVQAGAPWDAVLHLAAQVAVTTSVTAPREDFEINALGTFNVLEALRAAPGKPLVVYASTNKVYGGLEDLPVRELPTRHAFADRPGGVGEDQPLDFHSPYGCSKGAADQYVRDYHRIYGLRTVVFRQSCIYGPRQFGVEDQGWLAHFMIAHSRGRGITVYGDGKQVRDILHVDDLVDAYRAAVERGDAAAGGVFNIGGGPGNTLSILEALERIEAYSGKPVAAARAGTRPGDQPVFVCDLSRAAKVLGWSPKTGVDAGVESLRRWVVEDMPALAAR